MALQMTTIFGSALAERVALEPLLTAPLLYLFSQQPQLFRDHVLKRFPKLASSTTITILKWLVALGLGKRLSQIVGSLALNNWQVMPSRSNWDWPNEIAVVTGGCSGFGELVAQGLAKKGVKVVILDIQDLPKSLQDNPKITFHKCDITDPSTVSEIAAKIRSDQGHPSILINNAGVAIGTTILDGTPETIRKTFDVNIISHFTLIREFVPNMVKENKGHVLAVASLAAFVTSANIVDYSCTKAAVVSLHEGLSQELKYRYNAPMVKSSVICPGYARTPLVRALEDSLKKHRSPIMSADTVANAIVKQILSGRSGQIIVPALAQPVAGLRGWPTWLGENFRDGASKLTAVGEVAK